MFLPGLNRNNVISSSKKVKSIHESNALLDIVVDLKSKFEIVLALN